MFPLPALTTHISGKLDQPALVVLHAIGTDARLWTKQADHLDSVRRIIAVEFPGHGGSPLPDGNETIERYADYVIHTLDQMGVREFDLLGLSLGGMVAVALTLAHPERVRRLIICDTRLDVPEQYYAMWDLLVEMAQTQGMDTVADFMVKRWFGDGKRAENPQIDEIREQLRQTSVNGFVTAARAIQKLDLLPQVGKLNVPTLFLVGSEDGALPDLMSHMHGEVADSQLAVLPDAGHLSNVDQAQAFTQAVRDFLTR
ncbi:MAG TPA: alpha/beta fold hydrolase [Alphaproteobacteria bacterium]|jgi:3-oxoadipate enol-lactonase